MVTRHTPRVQLIGALLVSSAISTSLLAYEMWRGHSAMNSYLLVNLLLAWIPVIFSFRLVTILRYKLWSSWEALGLSILWLIFLPNSFYMVSDFIHLRDVSASLVVYDAVMFSSFISTALALGFTSLFPVHLELRNRFSHRVSAVLIGLTIFIASVAIYAGRDLRWNSWNVFTNPGGLLFDMSDRLFHVAAYPQMLSVVITFFALIMSLYNLLWHGMRLARASSL